MKQVEQQSYSGAPPQQPAYQPYPGVYQTPQGGYLQVCLRYQALIKQQHSNPCYLQAVPYQQPSMPGQYAASHAAYQAFPSYPAQSYAYQPYQQHPQQKPPNAHTNQVHLPALPTLASTSSDQNAQVSPNLNFRACSQRLRAASHKADTTSQLLTQDHRLLGFLAVGHTASIPTCLPARQPHQRRRQHRVSSTAPTHTPTPGSLGGGSWDLSLPLVGLISTPLLTARSLHLLFIIHNIAFLFGHQTKLIWA